MALAIVRCQNPVFSCINVCCPKWSHKVLKKKKSQKTLDAVNIAAQDLIETGFRRQNQQK
jgi:hypothetical protein